MFRGVIGSRAYGTKNANSVTDVGNVGNRVGDAVVVYANIEQVVMDCLRRDAKMSTAKMAKVAHVTTRTIERVLGRLKASGCINRKGGTRGVWEVVG